MGTTQVGGNHYQKMGYFQPLDILEKWRNPDHLRGALMILIMKYLCRYPMKGGVEDLRKASDCLEKLINFECKIGELPYDD